MAESLKSVLPSRRSFSVIHALLHDRRWTTRILQYLAIAAALVNYRSWPLIWHFRIFRPIYWLRGNYFLVRATYLFSSKASWEAARARLHEKLCPVGKNPMDIHISYKTWAGPDDCSFNFHLSNSCYAKHLDAARLKCMLSIFPTFFRLGGWIALGGTHYVFLREIKMFSTYEIRMSIISWENKWLYILARYVTKPTGNRSKRKVTHKKSPDEKDPILAGRGVCVHFPAIRTPSSPSLLESNKRDSRILADRPIRLDHPATNTTRSPAAGDPVKPAFSALTQMLPPEPDGALVHGVSVSELCCKLGRITVPPALVLACDGLAAPVNSGAAPWSADNPPPHWERVKDMRGRNWRWEACTEKGCMKELRAFMENGWRKLGKEERWWEEALSGAVEERRRAGMKLVDVVRKNEV